MQLVPVPVSGGESVGQQSQPARVGLVFPPTTHSQSSLPAWVGSVFDC
jgi:hypothetical protein